MDKAVVERQLLAPLRRSASTLVLNSDAKIKMMSDKSIQVNLDCDPGEDPKKGKKYWQDVAGLRGARVEYLTHDLREMAGKHQSLSANVSYLLMKLSFAEKKVAELKAKAKYYEEEDYYPQDYSDEVDPVGL